MNNKKVLSIKTLISNGKYYIQIPVFITLAVFSILFTIYMWFWMMSHVSVTNIISTVFVTIVLLGVVLWLFCIRNLQKLIRSYKNIKSKNFYVFDRKIKELKAIDKSGGFYIVHFDEGYGYVPAMKGLSIEKGDQLYAVDLEKKSDGHNPLTTFCIIFLKNKWDISDELKDILK